MVNKYIIDFSDNKKRNWRIQVALILLKFLLVSNPIQAEAAFIGFYEAGDLDADFLLDVRVVRFLKAGYGVCPDSINVSEEDIVFGDRLSVGGSVVVVFVPAGTLHRLAESAIPLFRLFPFGRFESQEAPSLERELAIDSIVLNFARESEKFNDGIITGRNICVADNPVELVYLVYEGELSLRLFS